MNFRSYSTLISVINNNTCRLPSGIDLIVGIPRSGLMAAHIIALTKNLPVCDLDGFIGNQKLRCGTTRKITNNSPNYPKDARHVLIVDDNILSGNTLAGIKEVIHPKSYDQQFTYCTIFATKPSSIIPDIYFEQVPVPCLFEWNMMHHMYISKCCIEIDGVLCRAPTPQENDDGHSYHKFLQNAQPLSIPSLKIETLVTSRLEKYRPQTEAWLKNHNIRYDELLMLDLPNADTANKLNYYARFKASVYKNKIDSLLFIENQKDQAKEIAHLSGKHVLCFTNKKMYPPDISLAKIELNIKAYSKKVAQKAKSVANNVF